MTADLQRYTASCCGCHSIPNIVACLLLRIALLLQLLLLLLLLLYTSYTDNANDSHRLGNDHDCFLQVTQPLKQQVSHNVLKQQ